MSRATAFSERNESSVILTGTPSGGTFSGNGLTGNPFAPSTSGTGTIAVTFYVYVLVEAGYCTRKMSKGDQS